MTVRYYPAVIERGPTSFGVFFPDLPGCTDFGDTVQQVAHNAETGLQGHVEVSAECGDTLPEDMLAALDRHAKAHGYPRSGLLAQAARTIIRAV